MTRKQIAALFLCLALGASLPLLAACNGPLIDTNIGNTTVPTTQVVLPADLLGPTISLDMMDAKMSEYEQYLAEALGSYGIEYTTNPAAPMLPPGYDEPVTQPPPPPTTMPEGTKIQTNEGYEQLRKVNEIFGSGKFYLRGNGGAPESAGIPSAASGPMVIAIDGKKVMIESTADWGSLGSMIAQAEGKTLSLQERAAAKAQSIAMETLFGKKTRMILSPDGMYIAFPDKNKYIAPSELMKAAGLEEDEGEFDMSDFDLNALGINPGVEDLKPEQVESSKVTVGGKEYLCASISNKIDDPANDIRMDTTIKYYFLDGQLKRMETLITGLEDSEDGQMIMEIDEFHGNPDPKLFSVDGMRKAALQEIMNLFGTMGGGSLFGG